MTRKELDKIFEKTAGDNAFKGLLILAKYFNLEKKNLITGADHDVFWSVDVEEALRNGLTEEDAIELSKLNWMIDEDGECFSCFV